MRSQKQIENVLEAATRHVEKMNFQNDAEKEAEINKYIEKINDGEVKLESTPEWRSDEILEMAMHADSKKQAVELAKKALALNPNNVEASVFLIFSQRDEEKRLKRIESLKDKIEKDLKEQKYFEKDCIGHFWQILDTRSYMRVLSHRVTILENLKRYEEACESCEEIIRLNNTDNMGVRYDLMGLYVFLEKYDKLADIQKKYKEESIFYLFPSCLGAYKKGNKSESENLYRKILEINSNFTKILKTNNYDKNIEYYSPGSKEECILVTSQFQYLVDTLPGFIDFVSEINI